MTLTLDAHSEELIQQEIARGSFPDPAAVIAHALELVHAEGEEVRARAALDKRLDESWQQIQRGEGIPGDQIEAMLAARRFAR